jgi:hypothetical protein
MQLQIPWFSPTNLYGNLRLNPNHWGYGSLIAAIVPNYTFRPAIYIGPAGINRFPAIFASGGNQAHVAVRRGFGMKFTGGSANQILLTVNKTIYSGLPSISFVGQFQNNSSGASTDGFRKDGEFTPIQATSTTNAQAAIWTDQLYTLAYPNTYGATDVVTCGTTWSLTDSNQLRTYQSINGRAIATSNTVLGVGTVVATNAATPQCIGGNEGGAELFVGNIFHGYYFSMLLTPSQIASLFIDPAQIFVRDEDDLFAELVGVTAAVAPTFFQGSTPDFLWQKLTAQPYGPMTGVSSH